jgi:hypothetical protein
MRRREFIAGLGSAAMVPTLSIAQQSGTPVIGILTLGSRESRPDMPCGVQPGAEKRRLRRRSNRND